MAPLGLSRDVCSESFRLRVQRERLTLLVGRDPAVGSYVHGSLQQLVASRHPSATW